MRGAEAVGVHAEAHDVDRRLEQRGSTPAVNSVEGGLVGGTRFHSAVDDDRRVRLVAGQDHVERAAHRVHLGVVERPLRYTGA